MIQLILSSQCTQNKKSSCRIESRDTRALGQCDTDYWMYYRVYKPGQPGSQYFSTRGFPFWNWGFPGGPLTKLVTFFWRFYLPSYYMGFNLFLNQIYCKPFIGYVDLPIYVWPKKKKTDETDNLFLAREKFLKNNFVFWIYKVLVSFKQPIKKKPKTHTRTPWMFLKDLNFWIFSNTHLFPCLGICILEIDCFSRILSCSGNSCGPIAQCRCRSARRSSVLITI